MASVFFEDKYKLIYGSFPSHLSHRTCYLIREAKSQLTKGPTADGSINQESY